MVLLNEPQILAYFFFLLLAVALLNAGQLLLILRKLPAFATLRILLGYFSLSLWVVTTVGIVLLHDAGIIMLSKSAPYAIILYILTIQLLIHANYPLTPRPIRFVNAALALGWIALGMIISQLFFPNVTFVIPHATNGAYAPIVHPAFIVISAFRGVVFLFLIFSTIKRIASNDNEPKPIVEFAGIFLGIFGFIALFTPNLVQSSNSLALFLYFLARLMILGGITFFLERIRRNPLEQLGAILGVNLFFKENLAHLALYGYGDQGVKVLFHSSFPFYQNEDERYANVLSLGMAGITALGRGEEYIEGSAIIPIINPFQMTGLVLTAWINDPYQPDPRLQKKTYLALLIILNRQFDFLFRNRKIWEKEFRKFIDAKNDLSKINPEMVFHFAKQTLILSAIFIPRYQ